LKSEVHVPQASSTQASTIHGRIRIKDKEELPQDLVTIKPADGKVKFKENKKDSAKSNKISEPTSIRVRPKSADGSPRIISKLTPGVVKVCKI